VNRDKQYSEKSEIKPLEKIVPDDFYNKSRKEKIKVRLIYFKRLKHIVKTKTTV